MKIFCRFRCGLLCLLLTLGIALWSAEQNTTQTDKNDTVLTVQDLEKTYLICEMHSNNFKIQKNEIFHVYARSMIVDNVRIYVDLIDSVAVKKINTYNMQMEYLWPQARFLIKKGYFLVPTGNSLPEF